MSRVADSEEECVCTYCRKPTKKGHDECPRCGNVFKKDEQDE